MLDQMTSQYLMDHGWYYTANFYCYGMPNGVDIHTHGVFENFNHRDLQVCLPITTDELDTVAWLFEEIINEIKKGNTFEPGKAYIGLLPEPHTLSFIEVIAGGRKYLRILYPDPNGSLDEFPFNTQLSFLTDGSSLKPLHYDVGDIANVVEVARFILILNTEHNINFDPDMAGRDYICIPTGKPAFNEKEAAIIDRMSQHCRTVVEPPYCIHVLAKKMALAREAMTPNAWMRPA